MIAVKSLAVHGAILVVAGVLALKTYTAEEGPADKHVEVELWGGSPEQIERVRYEAEAGKMSLEQRTDSEGRYYIGSVVKIEEPKANDPHNPHASDEPSEPAPQTSSEMKKAHFIAAKEGEELFEKLAPLQALRSLGKIEDARKSEFGLDQEHEEGTLYVKVGGKEHSLVFGGATPGGTDRYVRDPVSGKAYVISGTILRDLTNADQRLVERKLHAFEDADVERVKITQGDASRELVRHAEKKDFWAKPASPEEKDETASNWMSKVERLRVTSYEGEKLEPPATPADQVVRIEYFDDRRPIGFLELVRRPGDSGDETEYVARTEHSRWYAQVLRSTAEQIDQDAKSVLSP